MTPDISSHTIAIIQARMGSSRLPGKVLLDLAGQPMLRRVVERTRRAKTIDQVVVATTTEPSDDPVVELCTALGYACYRGSLYDVLDRYYQAARQFEASNVVRITADCPLIDPQVVDRTVQAFLGLTKKEDIELSDPSPVSTHPNHKFKIINHKSAAKVRPAAKAQPYDFVANRLPPPWGRTYPIGLDTEVCTFAALESAWNEARAQHQREHVMPFFYENLQRFRVLLVNHSEDFGTFRWTVDTAEDLEALRQIYARFPGRDDFSWLEVLALYQREPQLAQINAQVQHKHYQQVDERQK
jgi:spore coat polysaccharide biosynthesis protein SpsF